MPLDDDNGLPNAKGALNIMKSCAPVRFVTGTRPRKLLIKLREACYAREQIRAPSLAFLRFANSAEIPCTKREMASLGISNHVRLDYARTGDLVSDVVKLYKVSVFYCVAKNGEVHTVQLTCGGVGRVGGSLVNFSRDIPTS